MPAPFRLFSITYKALFIATATNRNLKIVIPFTPDKLQNQTCAAGGVIANNFTDF